MRSSRALTKWTIYVIALGLVVLVLFLAKSDPDDGNWAVSDPKPATDTVATQTYRVVEEKDSSFGNVRYRVTLEIESELATTDVAALETMMKAAVDRHRQDWPDAVSVRLWDSYEKDSSIRNRIVYAPDKCGWSGDDCGAALWSDLYRGIIPDRLADWGSPTDAEREAERDLSCRQDIQCWDERHIAGATAVCQDLIERTAQYDYEWTDGLLEHKFQSWRWDNQTEGTIAYTGDLVKFQNVFGAWQRVTYSCYYDPKRETAHVQVIG